MLPSHSALTNSTRYNGQAQFENYVHAASFPCVGARSAINRGRAVFRTYSQLAEPPSSERLCADLQQFSTDFPKPEGDPVTFVAMFRAAVRSEDHFESLMWQHLQLMHQHDRAEFEWDSTVSADPSDSNFSFSIAGRAFFVVGLSPVAPRLARRAPMPCLVFNFHNQFEALRASAKYAGLQCVVRNRDLMLQGSINPMLDVFGEASEARQYSGRAHDAAWTCPFHAETTHAH